MKKVLNTIKKIIIGILLTVYFVFVISISILLIAKNDYGYTQFEDKALIMIDKTIANENYPTGTLAIVQTTKLSELQVGDEIFVYESTEDNTVQVAISKIGAINNDASSPYVTLEEDGKSWGEKYIAGKIYKKYDKIGGFLLKIESKWIFFIALIVPCFFILIYEIYQLIVFIKFGDKENPIIPQNTKTDSDSQDKINQLMNEINSLKQNLNTNQTTPATTTNNAQENKPVETQTVVPGSVVEQSTPTEAVQPIMTNPTEIQQITTPVVETQPNVTTIVEPVQNTQPIQPAVENIETIETVNTPETPVVQPVSEPINITTINENVNSAANPVNIPQATEQSTIISIDE